VATQKIHMSGVEFVEKLLQGEKQFNDVVLEPGFGLSRDERFPEIQKLLDQGATENKPVFCERADFTGLDADGITLPYLKANGACFKHATFMDGRFESSEFERCDFRYARFPQADMKTCHFRDADFRQADLNMALLNSSLLSGANMAGANLLFTNLQASDIKGIVNLELARAVETANFQFVSLGDRERSIIRMEMWAQAGKKLRLFGGAG
jgi:uncharacterized protein YjbI with pentapeptide repeats